MATGQYRKPEPLPTEIPTLKYQATNFSPHHAALNKYLKKYGFIPHDEAAFINQTTMNSFVRREFLERSREGYIPTNRWFHAINKYEHTEIVKAHASASLGKYVQMLETVRQMRSA